MVRTLVILTLLVSLQRLDLHLTGTIDKPFEVGIVKHFIHTAGLTGPAPFIGFRRHFVVFVPPPVTIGMGNSLLPFGDIRSDHPARPVNPPGFFDKPLRSPAPMSVPVAMSQGICANRVPMNLPCKTTGSCTGSANGLQLNSVRSARTQPDFCGDCLLRDATSNQPPCSRKSDRSNHEAMSR